MSQKINEKIIAISVEANGIWGQPFVIAVATLDPTTGSTEEKIWRCTIEEPIDEITHKTLLPNLRNIPVTHESYIGMLKDFSTWWLGHKRNTTLVYQSGFVIESHLFRELHSHRLIGDYDTPLLTIDILPILKPLGYPFYTREQYCIDNGLYITDDDSIESDVKVILNIYLLSIINKGHAD